jgi:hypothetical protein
MPEPEKTPEGRIPSFTELLLTYGDDFEAEAPPEVVRAAITQIVRDARAEAERARDAGLAERPAGRAMDGLADCADWILVSPRTGPIERYRARALEVEAVTRTLNALVDRLLEDTDDWLAHDPLLGADEFERIAFASAQETIFAKVKDTAGEVAAKADELRGLL